MRLTAILLFLVLSSIGSSQTIDTLTIKYSESKYDTTFYKRIVQHDPKAGVYHVTDTYLSGQPALKGDYLSIDPTVKEEFWNYHQTHIKHGYFRKWYNNGQLEWEGRFVNGLIQGKATSWHRNGQLNYTGEYRHGMQHGSFTYYDEIVDVKETYQIARRLDQCNVSYSLSIFDGHKHWQTQWEVYGEDTIYDWFLSFRRHQTQ